MSSSAPCLPLARPLSRHGQRRATVIKRGGALFHVDSTLFLAGIVIAALLLTVAAWVPSSPVSPLRLYTSCLEPEGTPSALDPYSRGEIEFIVREGTPPEIVEERLAALGLVPDWQGGLGEGYFPDNHTIFQVQPRPPLPSIGFPSPEPPVDALAFLDGESRVHSRKDFQGTSTVIFWRVLDDEERRAIEARLPGAGVFVWLDAPPYREATARVPPGAEDEVVAALQAERIIACASRRLVIPVFMPFAPS
ncbi:MAG: hypothetical protein HY520_04740 [Candidatus Aenigmarchaeota archaeon]|nr:hypothetical protein [Candidatus Aenigmarchaeota archaeon]